MSLFKLSFAVILSAAALGAPASAEQRPRPDRDATTPEEVRVFACFSNCVARFNPTRSRALLALDFRTEQYRRELAQLAQANTECLRDGGRLGFGGVLFAGGLAESLLRRGGALPGLSAFVAHDPARPAIAARDEIELMALCVVRASPGKVSALFQAAPTSYEEGEALRALMPDFNSCLSAGSSVRVNRLSSRAILALAAYRLVDHNRWNRVPAAATPPGG